MTDVLDLFLEPLASALSALKAAKLPHVVIGGIAVSQLGKPRTTADIDILALAEDDNKITALIEAAKGFELVPRISDAEQFAKQNRTLLLVHPATRIEIDISLGFLPFEREAVEKRSIVSVRGVDIPFPAVEDLIIMKAVAHRERDLQDIESLVESNPDIDRHRIKSHVLQFASLLETPDIIDDLLEILDSAHPSAPSL